MLRPEPGLEIDGFTLGDKVHTGGFATIWSVTHPTITGPLVMKVPTIHDGYDGPTIVGFEVEQMIMPRLTGPHVPRVHGIGDFNRLPYIVTERIPGHSLLTPFKSAPLALAAVVDLGRRLATAVHALHLQQVAHLDLKPDNILERPSGEAVLIDFGLSRHDHLPDLLAEEFTIPMGTYPYIAPEQVLRQREDPRSDLFALGAILYEAATGRLPFGSPDRQTQLRRRFWRDPEPPAALNPAVPDWLQEVILRALEVDPARRYQSAAQMGYDLAHPATVQVTARGRKRARDPLGTVVPRWWRMRRLDRFDPPESLAAQIARAPILLVALDLSPEGEALHDPLMLWVRRMLSLQPDARIAVVNVIRLAVLGIDLNPDAGSDSLRVARLVRLRAWGEALALDAAQLTCSVLESADPAAAIIDHAQAIRADHVLMGARGSSPTRRYLGSVSAKVVAEARCSVTVIRQGPGEEAT